MNQEEAITELTFILGYEPESVATCTGDIDTCSNDECMVCGIRDCPHREPLHYHHDGCPACHSINFVSRENDRPKI